MRRFFDGFKRPLPEASIDVSIAQLCSLEKWSKKGQYELMFAKKRGLPIPYFPISHSAIALANKENNKYAIYGRQSPLDCSIWRQHGLHFYTRQDNEKLYLSKHFHFTLYPTGVFFSPDEIDFFLNAADEMINKAQSCNMIKSNCYSYSVAAMTFAIESLLQRPEFDSSAIEKIIHVLEQHPLNDHCAIGVLNNVTVVHHLLNVLEQVQRRIPINKSDSDEELNKHLTLMIKKIEEGSKQYRIFSLCPHSP